MILFTPKNFAASTTNLWAKSGQELFTRGVVRHLIFDDVNADLRVHLAGQDNPIPMM